MTETPTLRSKLPFWLLLGVLSVAIAEVSVASAPFAFVNPFESVFLVAFYGSHLLVLALLTFRRGWPTLPALWFAGVLFGLYEFYITKVLWSPPWGDVISLGHIDVVSFIVLAFFWHPFMAFILPIAVAERVGTTTRWTVDLLPLPSRRVAVGLACLALVTHGALTGSPAVAVVSTVSAVTAVATTSWWWRRNARHRQWTLRALLPTDRQGKWLALLLALQYVIFIPAWTPEKMPPLVGHVVVWLLYAGFALLFHSALQRSLQVPPGTAAPWVLNRSKRRIAVVGILGLTMIGSLAPAELGFIPVWGIAIWIGLRMFYRSVKSTFSEEPPLPTDQPKNDARLP